MYWITLSTIICCYPLLFKIAILFTGPDFLLHLKQLILNIPLGRNKVTKFEYRLLLFFMQPLISLIPLIRCKSQNKNLLISILFCVAFNLYIFIQLFEPAYLSHPLFISITFLFFIAFIFWTLEAIKIYRANRHLENKIAFNSEIYQKAKLLLESATSEEDLNAKYYTLCQENKANNPFIRQIMQLYQTQKGKWT